MKTHLLYASLLVLAPFCAGAAPAPESKGPTPPPPISFVNRSADREVGENIHVIVRKRDLYLADLLRDGRLVPVKVGDHKFEAGIKGTTEPSVVSLPRLRPEPAMAGNYQLLRVRF